MLSLVSVLSVSLSICIRRKFSSSSFRASRKAREDEQCTFTALGLHADIFIDKSPHTHVQLARPPLLLVQCIYTRAETGHYRERYRWIVGLQGCICRTKQSKKIIVIPAPILLGSCRFDSLVYIHCTSLLVFTSGLLLST